MSSRTVLDSVAMAYQPVWNRRRQLAAVRLRVLTVHHDSVDAEHFFRAMGGHWPAAAPVLILSFASASLLEQALQGEPLPRTWLEVPGSWFDAPEGLARLAVSVRHGHQLLRRAPLGDLRGAAVAPLDVRSVLHISPEEALIALQARPVEGAPPPPVLSPIRSGELYEGVCNHSLAQHCLDEAGAWGLVGWPDDDVLFAWRHRAVGFDASVLSQIREGVAKDRSLDHIERLIRQDPVIAYRLLLLVNSAAQSTEREINTLRHAIMMLGFTALNRWLNELQAGCDANPALHPVRYAQVMRARLAQHLLDSGAEENLRAEVFLAAVFAQLDRLLQVPLAALLEKLPLPQRTTDALLHQKGPYFPFIDLAGAQGQIEELHRLPALCEEHGISLEQANRALLRMIATSRDDGGAIHPLPQSG